MGAKTGIEWCDSTWNPIRGCSRVSEGCRHCYAESVAARFSKPGLAYEGLAVMQHGKPHWTGRIEFVEKHLLDPLKWGPVIDCVGPSGGCVYRSWWVRGRRYGLCKCPERPRRIFVNSMSDLFHENVTDEMRDKIFAVMALCPQHTFQVLTKRPARMLEYLSGDWHARVTARIYRDIHDGRVMKGATQERAQRRANTSTAGLRDKQAMRNVWLGVSVENQQAADERIPLLLQTPAAVRFISAEPLLGDVDLYNVARQPNDLDRSMPGFADCSSFYVDALFGCEGAVKDNCESFERDRGSHSHLDWVICGGESGPGARPMHPEWARGLRDQCEAAGVPFFCKQWGEWTPGENVDAQSGTVRTADWFDGKWLYSNEDLAGDEGRRDDEPDLYRIGKHAAGALLDGKEWKQFPEMRMEDL